MTSQLKLETARRNGAKSRGPKTAEGKRISSQNATKHGLTSKSVPASFEPEDHAVHTRLLAALNAAHPSSDPVESDLIRRLALAKTILWRTRRLQVEVMAEEMRKSGQNSPGAALYANRGLADALNTFFFHEIRWGRFVERLNAALKALATEKAKIRRIEMLIFANEPKPRPTWPINTRSCAATAGSDDTLQQP